MKHAVLLVVPHADFGKKSDQGGIETDFEVASEETAEEGKKSDQGGIETAEQAAAHPVHRRKEIRPRWD